MTARQLKARYCPVHGGRMTYAGPGATWEHLWRCNASCMWGAADPADPMVAGYYGAPEGDGYLTWEQWLATQAARGAAAAT